MGDTQFSLLTLALDAYVLARNSNVNVQAEIERVNNRINQPRTEAKIEPSGALERLERLERSEVARINNLLPSQSNTRQNLTILAEIFKKAIEKNDQSLARECQLTAVKYVAFIYEKLNPEPFADTAASLGIHIPNKISRSKKAGHIASQIYYNPSHALGKIMENVGKGGHRPEYISGSVELTATGNRLSGGVENFALHLNNEKIGEVLMVPPEAAVSASYLVYDQQDYTGYDYGESTKDFILFSSANYASDFVDNIPATLSIVNGKPRNLFLAPQMHGLVTIDNGRPKINNIKLQPPLPIISAALAPGSSVSMFQTNLIVDGGQNLVPDKESSPSRDRRRVLLTGGEGQYGIVQVNSYVDLFELGSIVAKLPNVGSAVNLDTGGCDLAGYRTTGGGFVWLGDKEAKTITLFGIKSNEKRLAAR
ncbi:MAG: hypothetical protein WC632_07920 [Candidatus Margulisiibacteriota bacterium]